MRIFLASTFTLEKQPELLSLSKYLLESFYYIKPWQMPYLLNADEFILDSGAFSYMTGVKGTKTSDVEAYCRRYANFVKEYDIKNFIELDVQNVYGIEEYKRINDILVSIVGREPIRVMHKNMGLDWWEKVTKENDFVAYGGISAYRQNMKDIDYAVIPQFIKIAHDNGARVHGLGFTQVSKFNKIKFDTVDSTSWKVAERYGIMTYFTGTSIKNYRPKGNGRHVKDVYKLREFNYKEWIKFQDYADKYL